MIAFGLDLAGYSTGKSALAMAQRNDQEIVVTVFTSHPLATRIRRRDLLAHTVDQERECIRQCCQVGSMYVDIPIDMQGLPYPAEVRYVWQLTHRAVDYAYNAMPAFADRIGSPAARFLNLMRGLPPDWLGSRIFETYPAQSLTKMGLTSRGYKGGSCIFQNGQWTGDAVSLIAGSLSCVAEEGCSLDDDEFDAVICALTGVADSCLCGAELDTDVTSQIHARSEHTQSESFATPNSYVLMLGLPKPPVYIHKRVFDEIELRSQRTSRN